MQLSHLAPSNQDPEQLEKWGSIMDLMIEGYRDAFPNDPATDDAMAGSLLGFLESLGLVIYYEKNYHLPHLQGTPLDFISEVNRRAKEKLHKPKWN